MALIGTILFGIISEMLGCVLVFGILALGVAAAALLINHSPVLLNYDYAFFSTHGLLPIMATGYEFILVCFIILITACSTAAGVTIADLYRVETCSGMPGIP